MSGAQASRQPQESLAYLTPAEVADLLRVSVKTVYRLAAQEPTMPMLKLGGSVRFPRERLLRWLDQRTQGTPQSIKRLHVAANGASSKEPASV